MAPTLFKKICLLGDFAVGKTSLVRRYVDNQFSDDYLSTLGVKLSRKMIQLSRASGEELALQLVLWDLEGKSNFADSSSSYLRGANGAIIVGDLTRAETIANLSNHIDVFLSINPKAFIAVANNKEDLLPELSTLPRMEFHSDRIVHVQLTSAKNGKGVGELFEALSRKLAEG